MERSHDTIATRGHSPRRIPLGLLGMLLAIVAVEVGIARTGWSTWTSHELDWHAAGRDAQGVATRADVLLLGDSMVKFGVNPRVLERLLQRPVHGLALLNGRPPASYFLLRRAIEAGARPRVVVVDYQPECMLEAHDHLLANPELKGLLSPRESAELAWVYGDPSFLARAVLAWALPSVFGRQTIRSWVVAAITGGPHPTRDENARVSRNRAVNQGGILLAPNPAFRGEIPPRTLEVVADPDWFHRPAHTRYVREFVRLARRHGISVVWLLPPNAPRAEEEKERRGVAERYTRFARSVQAWEPALTVVDARRAGFDVASFTDAVHLNRQGAATLSARLAPVLQELLDAPPTQGAWVTLPPSPVPELPELALEDMEESNRLLAARGFNRH